MLRKWGDWLREILRVLAESREAVYETTRLSVSFEDGGDGSRVLSQDSVTSQRPRVTGEAALTLGGLREGVLCVHVYVGRGRVGQAGKVREENGNEHLLSTYCMLDTFSVLFVKSFQ